MPYLRRDLELQVSNGCRNVLNPLSWSTWMDEDCGEMQPHLPKMSFMEYAAESTSGGVVEVQKNLETLVGFQLKFS